MNTDPGSGVDLGAVAQQDADDVSLVGARRKVQRGLPSHCRHVRVCFVLQQVYHNVHAAHEAGYVQGCEPRLLTYHKYVLCKLCNCNLNFC